MIFLFSFITFFFFFLFHFCLSSQYSSYCITQSNYENQFFSHNLNIIIGWSSIIIFMRLFLLQLLLLRYFFFQFCCRFLKRLYIWKKSQLIAWRMCTRLICEWKGSQLNYCISADHEKECILNCLIYVNI